GSLVLLITWRPTQCRPGATFPSTPMRCDPMTVLDAPTHASTDAPDDRRHDHQAEQAQAPRTEEPSRLIDPTPVAVALLGIQLVIFGVRWWGATAGQLGNEALE